MQAPAAMDGIPAPISRLTDPSTNPETIALVTEVLMFDLVIGEESASIHWDTDMNWYGPYGIGYAPNRDLYTQHFLQPLREAFSDRELQVSALSSDRCPLPD